MPQLQATNMDQNRHPGEGCSSSQGLQILSTPGLQDLTTSVV